MTPRTLEYADLSPESATVVGNRMVELAAQSEKDQVVRVTIVIGGAVGSSLRMVAADLRKEGEAPRFTSPRR